jgi:uncharacterized protein YjbI with pentapeptide repeats
MANGEPVAMLSARRTSTGRPQSRAAPATAFFISANLSPQGAILHRANLVGTNLIGANLTWANVAAANLSDAASAIQGSAGFSCAGAGARDCPLG